MRNYDGYNETREILLNNNPNTTMMWTSYAFSFHLLKEYDLAVKVLDTYLAALEAVSFFTSFAEHQRIISSLD